MIEMPSTAPYSTSNSAPTQTYNQAPMYQVPPTPVNESRSWRTPLIIWLAILTAGLLALFVISMLRGPQNPRVLTTVGSATLEFDTNKATMVILFTKQGQERNSLVRSAQQEFSALIDEIKNYPVDSVSQSSYQIIPLATNQLTNPLFEFRQGAEIVVTDQNDIEAVFSLLSTLNVNVVQTRFAPADEPAARQVLLEAAITDAEQKAEALAGVSDISLGKILSIAEMTSVTNSTQVSSGQNTGAVSAADNMSKVKIPMVLSVTYQLR